MRFQFIIFSLFALMMSTVGNADTAAINTAATATDKTSTYYQKILRDPQALRVFFENMPKGGMLHEHFMGGDFPENLLDIGAKAKFCIDPGTYRISTEGDHCPNYRRLMNIRNQPELYHNIIDAWSMRNFVPSNTENAHDHFFNAFDKFFYLQNAFRGAVLASEVEEAASEKVDYLELSVLNQQDAVLKLAGSIPATSDPEVMRQSLLKSGIAKIVDTIQGELSEDEKTMRQRLGCDQPDSPPACQVEVRYQYAAFRNGTPAQVFAGLLTGFLLAEQDHRVVGINLRCRRCLSGYARLYDPYALCPFLTPAISECTDNAARGRINACAGTAARFTKSH
jgi:adenosine deaminase